MIFKKKTPSAYNASLNRYNLDDICSHMKSVGNRYKRCIYSYVFSDNSVYVGLTSNLKNRHYRHLKKGTVYNYIINSGFDYEIFQLTKYIDVELAKQKEGEFVNKYKNDNYTILNKAKTGGVGSTIKKWTYDKCKEEALKYKN